MVLEIMAGISKTLNLAFGNGFEIYYSRDVRQGLQEPCFIIALVASSRARQIGARYSQAHSFVVHYFPAAKGGNAEMAETAETLYDALEFFPLPDGALVRGTGMRYEAADGALHFFVDVNVFLKRLEGAETMETLDASLIVL